MQEAAHKAAADEEEERLREEAQVKAAATAAAEERAALQKQWHIFIVRTTGRVAVSKARPGLFTDGPVRLPAKVEMAAEVSNVLVGELGPVSRAAATLDDAQVHFLPSIDVNAQMAAAISSSLKRGLRTSLQECQCCFLLVCYLDGVNAMVLLSSLTVSTSSVLKHHSDIAGPDHKRRRGSIELISAGQYRSVCDSACDGKRPTDSNGQR